MTHQTHIRPPTSYYILLTCNTSTSIHFHFLTYNSKPSLFPSSLLELKPDQDYLEILWIQCLRPGDQLDISVSS